MKPNSQNSLIERIFIVILIVFVPVLGTDKTLDPGLHLQFVSLTLLLLGLWITFSYRKKELNIRSNIVLSFFIIYSVLLLYSIISIIISNNIADGIFFFTKYVLFFILTISFLYFRNSDDLFNMVSRSAILLSLIVVFPACYQLFELIKEKELIIPSGTYQIYSLLPHRNLLSEILVLTLPFSAYAFFSEKNYWKYIGITSFNLSLLLIIILSNRASWLSAISISILVIFILFIKRQGFIFDRVKKFFAANTFIILILSYLFLIGFSDSSGVKSHALNSLDFTNGSTKDRIELWSRTSKMISEKPILGGGLGSWKINILKFGNKGLVSENNTTFYQRPHNDFLWVAAEQGIIGFVLYFLLFVLIFAALIKTLLSKKDNLMNNQLLVILSVTTGFIIFSLFSFPKERISHNIILFAAWGLFLNMINSASHADSKKTVSFRNAGYFLTGILIIISFIGFARINAEIHTKKAIIAKRNSRFQRCIYEIDQAESFFYRMDETSTPLKWYSGLSYFRLQNYEKAVKEFEIALRINPYHIYTLNDYAGSLTKINQNNKAIEFYNKSISIAPNFPETKLNLCALYFNNHNYSEAFRVLKTMDVNSTSERYIKTVTVIINKLIGDEYKTSHPEPGFYLKFQKEKNNFNFYRQILSAAVKYDLQPNELINIAERILDQRP
jgi:O-antigen ligase